MSHLLDFRFCGTETHYMRSTYANATRGFAADFVSVPHGGMHVVGNTRSECQSGTDPAMNPPQAELNDGQYFGGDDVGGASLQLAPQVWGGVWNTNGGGEMTIATTVKFDSDKPVHPIDFASQNQFNFTSSAMDDALPNTPVFSFSKSVSQSAPHGMDHAIVLGRKGSSGKLMVMVNPQCASGGDTCNYSFIAETVNNGVIHEKCEQDFCHISIAVNETLDSV